MTAKPSVVVRCKGCALVIHPLPTKPSHVRGVRRVRFEYQCENPECDQVGYTQHRSQPVREEVPCGE